MDKEWQRGLEREKRAWKREGERIVSARVFCIFMMHWTFYC